MRAAALLLTAIAALAGATGAQAIDDGSQVAPDVRVLVQRFVETTETLPGYQVVMRKQQRVGAELGVAETLLLKQQKSPDCRYMKWIAEPHQGRELILCSERYDGKIRVHESGILGIATISLDPNGSMARRGNLRPVSQAGIYNMAKMLKANIEKRQTSAQVEPPPQTSERVIEGQASLCLHSQTIGSDDKAPYPVGAAELCFDKTIAMPTEVQFWHQDGRLMEHYTFRDWNLKPGLSDQDFDTANEAYGF